MSSDSDKQAKGANTANSPKATNQTSLTSSELDVKKIGSSTSKEGKHYDSLADADQTVDNDEDVDDLAVSMEADDPRLNQTESPEKTTD